MALYWNARAASSMPTVQLLAYYQVLEFYFSRIPQSERGRRWLLSALIEECATDRELRTILAESEERERFFQGTEEAREISGYVLSDRHRPTGTAARRIKQIRNRIVHADEGYNDPLLPSDPAAENLRHDIDLVRFLARKALDVFSRPLQV